MALRGTLTHWKTRKLAAALGIEPCFALGVLEALWHATAELAPAGNIGRLPNEAIAMEMFYSGDADRLVNALIWSRHLDEHPEYRLIVHDWTRHSDHNTRRKVERNGGAMIDNDGSSHVMTRHKSIPEPEPEPVPDPEPEKKLAPETCDDSQARDTAVERIYQAYPRKVAPKKARIAIRHAVEHLQTGKDWPKLTGAEAFVFLYERVTVFARSPAGQAGEYTPHPATWFHQARYLDDPKEWERGKGAKGVTSGASGRGDAGESAASARNRRSSAAIWAVAEKYGATRPSGRADEGELSGAGDRAGDDGDVVSVVDGTCAAAHDFRAEDGITGAHDGITILPPPVGVARASGGVQARSG